MIQPRIFDVTTSQQTTTSFEHDRDLQFIRAFCKRPNPDDDNWLYSRGTEVPRWSPPPRDPHAYCGHHADTTFWRLGHQPTKYLILLVPQEGFEPPTPSLRSADSGRPNCAALLAPIHGNATWYGGRLRSWHSQILHLVELAWTDAHGSKSQRLQPACNRRRFAGSDRRRALDIVNRSRMTLAAQTLLSVSDNYFPHRGRSRSVT